jgi:hypothetical protein
MGQKMGPIYFSEDPYYNPNLSPLSENPILPGKEYEPRCQSFNQALMDFGIDKDLSLLQGMGAYPHLLTAHQLTDISVLRFSATQPYVARLIFLSPGLQNEGVAFLFYSVAKYLQQRGYDMSVGSPCPGPLRDAYDAAGIPVFINPLIASAPYALPELFDSYDGVLVSGIVLASAISAAVAAGKRPLWLLAERTLPDSLPANGQVVEMALAGAELLVLSSSNHEEWVRRFSRTLTPKVTRLGLDARTLSTLPTTMSESNEHSRVAIERLAGQLLSLGLGTAHK